MRETGISFAIGLLVRKANVAFRPCARGGSDSIVSPNRVQVRLVPFLAQSRGEPASVRAAGTLIRNGAAAHNLSLIHISEPTRQVR